MKDETAFAGHSDQGTTTRAQRPGRNDQGTTTAVVRVINYRDCSKEWCKEPADSSQEFSEKGTLTEMFRADGYT